MRGYGGRKSIDFVDAGAAAHSMTGCVVRSFAAMIECFNSDCALDCLFH